MSNENVNQHFLTFFTSTLSLFAVMQLLVTVGFVLTNTAQTGRFLCFFSCPGKTLVTLECIFSVLGCFISKSQYT